MATYLIDENLPRSLAPSLRRAGLEVEDVRDQGLRGRPDSEVFALSLSRGWILVTGDLGFGSLARSTPSFPGVVLVRLPDEWPTERVNEVIFKALQGLKGRKPGEPSRGRRAGAGPYPPRSLDQEARDAAEAALADFQSAALAARKIEVVQVDLEALDRELGLG